MSKRKFLVSVIGGHKCDDRVAKLAGQVGEIIAGEDAALVCGGLGGIMEAACQGAKKHDGLTIGITPGRDKSEANRFVDIAIPTGMGHSRNTLVAVAGDLVVALPGEYGTLSEISFALIAGRPVYGFDTWDIKGVTRLKNAEDLRDILRQKMKVGD